MRLRSLEAVFGALNEANVRYLVAGGLAVNAHGYVRTTQDVDIVLDLADENVLSALDALGKLGYQPVLPVPAEAFADADTRAEWISARNLQVFSLVSDEHPDVTVDLFAEEPFPFESERSRALRADLADGVPVLFVGLSTLIEMKEAAGRPRDRDDVEHLRKIAEETDPGPDRIAEGTGWEAATWAGNRREQLRRALRLGIRERLEALEALNLSAEHTRGIAGSEEAGPR